MRKTLIPAAVLFVLVAQAILVGLEVGFFDGH
jgi:hypothetical protein